MQVRLSPGSQSAGERHVAQWGRQLWLSALQPLDIAALAAFRILFGLLLFIGTLRFMANGWVERLYLEPGFHFKYWGFSWVQVPGDATHLLFAGIAVSALLVALGAFYRVAIISFLLLFSYAELLDVTTYLNHHYLVILLALILCFLSPHRAWSVDAWRRPAIRRTTLPAWQSWWLRYQVALLYFYAGWAKFESDWLLHAQPLNIWLPPHAGLPFIGGFLDEVWVHFAFSWFAFAFDVSIIGFMLWRRSRPWAFALILLFHLLTHIFFNIGIFPFIMVLAVLIFFEPSWPRRLARRCARLFGNLRDPDEALRDASAPSCAKSAEVMPPPARHKFFAAVLLSWCLLQFLLPLRHWLYPGTVLWHEQGMRYSWRVMLREKSGSLAFSVVGDQGQTQLVSPHDYLSDLQYREMAGQPDLILQLAHRVRDDFSAAWGVPVQVYADSWVSLNGRTAARMIDPQADLARITDGVARADWITAAPQIPPRTHPPLRLAVRK